MAQAQAVAEHSKRKQVPQPPAVPFLWEVKPGTPKKDWKPGVSLVSPVVTPPIKLIASVPFDWEEKPGKPLPCFPEQDVLPSQREKLLCLPLPPMFSQGYGGPDYDNDEYNSDDGQDEEKGSFELDFEAFDFDTDDSFSSAPSLLANCLVPSVAVSSAVPVGKPSSSDDRSGELEIPSTPASETDSSTSSYATGTSGLVGASFLECLFPLLPPKSSFLEKARYSESDYLTPAEVKTKDFDRESNSSVVIRRPTTLGEMIMMSRRRSYQRKAVQMRKQNLSMVNPQLSLLFLIIKTAFGLGYSKTWKCIGNQ